MTNVAGIGNVAGIRSIFETGDSPFGKKSINTIASSLANADAPWSKNPHGLCTKSLFSAVLQRSAIFVGSKDCL